METIEFIRNIAFVIGLIGMCIGLLGDEGLAAIFFIPGVIVTILASLLLGIL